MPHVLNTWHDPDLLWPSRKIRSLAHPGGIGRRGSYGVYATFAACFRQSGVHSCPIIGLVNGPHLSVKPITMLPYRFYVLMLTRTVSERMPDRVDAFIEVVFFDNG